MGALRWLISGPDLAVRGWTFRRPFSGISSPWPVWDGGQWGLRRAPGFRLGSKPRRCRGACFAFALSHSTVSVLPFPGACSHLLTFWTSSPVCDRIRLASKSWPVQLSCRSLAGASPCSAESNQPPEQAPPLLGSRQVLRCLVRYRGLCWAVWFFW